MGTAGRELLAGFSNALALLSGFLVIPSLLFRGGMDFTGAYTACILGALAGTLLLGRLAARPLVAVPGAAMAGWLVYVEIISHGIRWQAILGASFLASFLGFLLLLSPLRRRMAEAVPGVLRRAMACGLGVLLILEGLMRGRLLVGSPFSVTMLGSLLDPVAYLSLAGILLTLVLLLRDVPGALAIGTLATAAASYAQGFWVIPDAPFLLPEGLDLVAFQLDVGEGILLPEIFLSILLVVLAESWGTVQAIHGAQGTEETPSRRGLLAVMGGGMLGTLLGSLPLRIAPESAAGIASGGRSGWTSYGTAIFLLPFLFCEPVMREMTTFEAIAVPILVGTGFSLLRSLGNPLEGDGADRAASLCLILIMPLAHDVVTGMGVSLILHVLLKAFQGNFSVFRSAEAGAAAMFAFYLL